ncbi:MAG: ABC transporter permease [Acidimicrobiia bacterium]
MRVFAFVDAVMRSIFRDRTALFFVIALPVAVIVIVGSTFGGQQRVEIGVVDQDGGPTARAIVAELRLQEGVSVDTFESFDELAAAVRRSTVAAGVVLPVGFEADVRGGTPAEVQVVAVSTSPASFTARTIVGGTVGRIGAQVGAAQIATTVLGGDFDDYRREAGEDGAGDAVTIAVEDVGGTAEGSLNRFSLTAPLNLVLFVFINAMGAAGFLVTVRRSGVLRRARATPTPTGTIVAGLGVGWFAFALAQSLIIVVIGALAFGVSWGQPAAAAALVVTFALVGAGAGLLVGTIGRDADKVSSLTPSIGLVLAALGGCMVPLELFPPVMQSIAHGVPHYWAVQGWESLVLEGGDIGSIAGDLLALVAFAAALLLLAGVLLRRQLAEA